MKRSGINLTPPKRTKDYKRQASTGIMSESSITEGIVEETLVKVQLGETFDLSKDEMDKLLRILKNPMNNALEPIHVHLCPCPPSIGALSVKVEVQDKALKHELNQHSIMIQE